MAGYILVLFCMNKQTKVSYFLLGPRGDVVPVARMEAFRALKFSIKPDWKDLVP